MANAKKKLTKNDYKIIEHGIENGHTQNNICKALNIPVQTFIRIKKRDPKCASLFERKTDILLLSLIETVVKLAKGYTVKLNTTKETTNLDKDGNVSSSRIESTDRDELIKPNITSLIYLISNLDNENWTRTDRHALMNDVKELITDLDEKTRLNILNAIDKNEIPKI